MMVSKMYSHLWRACPTQTPNTLHMVEQRNSWRSPVDFCNDKHNNLAMSTSKDGATELSGWLRHSQANELPAPLRIPVSCLLFIIATQNDQSAFSAILNAKAHPYRHYWNAWLWAICDSIVVGNANGWEARKIEISATAFFLSSSSNSSHATASGFTPIACPYFATSNPKLAGPSASFLARECAAPSLSSASITGICWLLYHFDGTVNRKWHDITLNAVDSSLTTLAQGLTLLVMAACSSQYKWI
ncbi:hypothetical protein E2P81_ATG06397 [Venturia nashicola]|nr:hypothetical protein E2P81_ATG06397 [Venturia nashicola]